MAENDTGVVAAENAATPAEKPTESKGSALWREIKGLFWVLLAVLLLGALGAALFLRGRNRAVAAGDTEAPLTPEERARLDKLLREDT